MLTIHSLDWFGRNKDEIIQEWNELTKTMQCDIVVLDMPLLDTREQNDSVRTFIVDMVLQILSWVAEEEQTRVRQRQREGINSAQRKGMNLGWPQVPLDGHFRATYDQWKEGCITAVEASRRINVNKTAYYRMVKCYESENT